MWKINEFLAISHLLHLFQCKRRTRIDFIFFGPRFSASFFQITKEVLHFSLSEQVFRPSGSAAPVWREDYSQAGCHLLERKKNKRLGNV